MSNENAFEGLNSPSPMLINPVEFMAVLTMMLGSSGLPAMVCTSIIGEAWAALCVSEVGEVHTDRIAKLVEIGDAIMELLKYPIELARRVDSKL